MKLTTPLRRKLLREVVEDAPMYNIIAAVRGPDVQGEIILKEVFTMRLRYFVLTENGGPKNDKAYGYSSESSFRPATRAKPDLDTWTLTEAGKEYSRSSQLGHYLEHTETAFRYLSKILKSKSDRAEAEALSTLAHDLRENELPAGGIVERARTLGLKVTK